MSAATIRIEGLTKQFANVCAVDNLTLEVASGSVFGFLGPNGSGKTTTIRLLLGLIEPTEGKLEVLGYDVRTRSEDVRAHSGALLEHCGIYERLTAQDNLRFFGRIAGMARAELKDRIRELLLPLELWDIRAE